KKFNQATMSRGYVTFWLSSWLQCDVPLLVGRNGMQALRLDLDVVDVRGYREHADQKAEIELVLGHLLEKVGPVGGDKSKETHGESSEDRSGADIVTEDPRVMALVELMAEGLQDGLEKVVAEVDNVTTADIEKYSGSIAGDGDGVNEMSGYLGIVVAMLKVVSNLFGGLETVPANVGKFRIELTDPDVVISEPYRRIRRDWAHEIYKQLVDMEKKKVIRPSTTEYH
ncbi:hypothetical protein ADUPG1_001832, partial [Aduncisulcus paluster]